jgi:hypothetical protein
MLASASRALDQVNTSWPGQVFLPDGTDNMRTGYNVRPFALRHSLAEHPLLSIDRMVDLCKFLERHPARNRVIHYTDDAKLTQGWSRTNTTGSKARDALANIQDAHSWVLLKDIQRCPDYAELPELFIRDIEAKTGRSIRADITWMDAYLFIASPRMMTPYHIDHECNFLLQIHGTKTIHLLPPDDRSILTEQEIEGYYAGDMNAAVYREEVAPKALSILLEPGVGVHHPPLAPHWVQYGDEYSISLSFLYFLRPYDRIAKVYQTNKVLRSLGLAPTPPGRSKIKDEAKIALMNDFGHRPKSKEEVVRFAYRRFTAPMRIGKRLFAKGRVNRQ